MSLVVFPFRKEDPRVVGANVQAAAGHPRVAEVLCVGYEEDETYQAIATLSPELRRATGTPVNLLVQDRIGTKRPGKGDGMNTALRYFVDSTDYERIHFYDSDIMTFDADWITKAEEAADFGYGVVRHYFPRASTDAMITWMITRTGFAMLWPHSELPWIEQPLGGELVFKRRVAETLLADPRVQAQSDWGIDTLYTFSTIQKGYSTYEVYIPQGKAHRLYGGLTDLRTMLVECFSAVQSLAGETITKDILHRIEQPDIVPQRIAERIGFDFEATLSLLRERWDSKQEELLSRFPEPVRDGMLANEQHPAFGFMDEDAWAETYRLLLTDFKFGDIHWERILFRLWTVRVLNYTTNAALRGYSYALRNLRGMIARYMRQAAMSEPS